MLLEKFFSDHALVSIVVAPNIVVKFGILNEVFDSFWLCLGDERRFNVFSDVIIFFGKFLQFFFTLLLQISYRVLILILFLCI